MHTGTEGIAHPHYIKCWRELWLFQVLGEMERMAELSSTQPTIYGYIDHLHTAISLPIWPLGSSISVRVTKPTTAVSAITIKKVA